ncbi:MAG: 50S ribosomal protein L18 [Beggiatoa sp. IS2]|jgi:large subunit ribosomal protein L18|nr:MAG: 50S ribosomal protein L18 [Beggiatoa sp. IS2]
MNKRKVTRLRRARRTRAKIKEVGVHRLCVNKTPKHIYVQLISPDGSRVLASASSLDKLFKQKASYGGNVPAAKLVGEMIAERAKAVGVSKVAFDRSGFKYHGRVKALADTARENGLNF